MNVEIKKLGNSRIELVIEQSTENVAKYRKKVIASAGQNANIKGFRKGSKIPEDVIVKEFGEERILQMTVEQAIDWLYKEALKKENLMPVSQAEITEVVSQDPLKVLIQVEIFPTVEIEDSYKDIKLKKQKLSVSESEVEDAIADIKTRFTHFHDAESDYAAKIGDKLTIDTDGYDTDGKMLEATSMRAYPLVLGSNLLVPGFEEDMVGMKVWDEKEMDVNFPKDYHNADFAGKKTKFKVKALKIERAHAPEFDKEFIQKLRGKDLDFEGFKKLLKEEILETKEANDAMERESTLIDELVKISKLEIGTELLARQTDQVYDEIKENVAKDGVKMDDYLASLNLSVEQYKKQHVEATALKRLQGEIIFNELMLKEKVEVTDDELKKEVEKIMSRYQSEDVLARLKELYVPGTSYYEELKRRMAYRKLIDNFFTDEKSEAKKK